MNAPRIIPDGVLRLQIAASDPAVSAWVAANAGSGKTHVLAQRVIRLLLDGVEPGKILCITFTKAAAANMANRVFDELRRWTALDDSATRCGDPADVQSRSRSGAASARTAIVRVGAGDAGWTQGPDHPRILHPASASVSVRGHVAARFDVLDEASEAQLLGETSLGVLLDATLAPDAPLGRALATAITFAADRTFKEVVGEAIRKRDVVRAWIDHGGSVDAAVALLCGTLGISRDDTLERVESEMIEGPMLPFSRMGGGRGQAPDAGLKERSGTSGAAHDALRNRGLRTGRHLSRSSFSPTNSKPASAWSPRQSRKVIPSSPNASQREGERLLATAWSVARRSPAAIARPRSSPSPMQ